VVLLLLAVLAAVVAVAESDMSSQLDSLVPDADLETGSAKVLTAPLKAKMFQLQKKLEKELEEVLKRKDDMAQALAKAKMQLEQAKTVYNAAKNELDRKTPDKMSADYNVVLVRASLEVVIRASKRQVKLNNLERDALYAQIKFAEEAQVLRSRVVGEKPPVALVSIEDLENEAGSAVRAIVDKKNTVLSNEIKKDLDAMLAECRARLHQLDEHDHANAAEIKRLQTELKTGLDAQSKAVAAWHEAKKDFKKAENNAGKHQGMYTEMVRISKRDGTTLDDKIRVVRKEIKLVGTMVTKIDAYKPAE